MSTTALKPRFENFATFHEFRDAVIVHSKEARPEVHGSNTADAMQTHQQQKSFDEEISKLLREGETHYKLSDCKRFACRIAGEKVKHAPLTERPYTLDEIDQRNAALGEQITRKREFLNYYQVERSRLSVELLAIEETKSGKALQTERAAILGRMQELEAELALIPGQLGVLAGRRSVLRNLQRLAKVRKCEEAIVDVTGMVAQRRKKINTMPVGLARTVEEKGLAVMEEELERLQRDRLAEIGHERLIVHKLEDESSWPSEAKNVASSTTARALERVGEARTCVMLH